MNEKEKARPRCCEHQGQAKAGNSLEGHIPANHYMSLYAALQAILPKEKENAMTATELAALTGVDPRQITREIQRIRRGGVPVCASSGEMPGYWISEDPREVEQYCKTLDRRLKNIRATREAVGGALMVMTGQMGIAGVEVNRGREKEGISKETL